MSCVFFFKHKTAYEMRISDWSSDVCSSDLHVAAIRADLAWLGLDVDGAARQSERFALYEAEFERLEATGRVYACYETPEELEIRRKILLSRGLPPVYERKAEGAPVPAGVAPHWRFRLEHDAPIDRKSTRLNSSHQCA